MHSLNSLLAIDILEEGVARLADVEHVPLPHSVARLDMGGVRPLLLLDSGSPEEDRCWALMDALRALAFGPHTAESARFVRRLRAVG